MRTSSGSTIRFTRESTARPFVRTQYDEFVPLGLVKFVGNLVSSHGFELLDCEAASLIRDEASPRRWFSTPLFRVGLPKASLRSLGRPEFLMKQRSARPGKRRMNGELLHLAETADSTRLQAQYSTLVTELLHPSALNCGFLNLNRDGQKTNDQVLRFVLRRRGSL